MKKSFIFAVSPKELTGLSYQDFLYFAAMRVATTLYFDSEEKKDDQIPVTKIQEIMEYVSSNIVIKEKADKSISASLELETDNF